MFGCIVLIYYYALFRIFMNKYFFYYFPFLLFILTQVILFFYFDQEKVLVPQLVGNYLSDLPRIFGSQYSFRIYKVSSNNEYEHNYIISQYPLTGSYMKANQVINIEVNDSDNKKRHKIFKNIFFNDFIEYSKKNNVYYKKIVFDFISDVLKEKILINTFDEKESLNIIYSLLPEKKNYFCIPNFYGQKCKDIALNNPESVFICHEKNNEVKNIITKDKSDNMCDFEVNIQYPLPGIYYIEKSKIEVHFWH